jgi:hypothetical protein
MAVKAIDIGPDPIPNNAMPLAEGESYGTPANFDEAVFSARHGSPQDYFNKVVTAILRPNLKAINDLLDSGVYTEAEAEEAARPQLAKQKAAIAYFAGEMPFSRFSSYLGGPDIMALRGVIVVSEIRDLGA